jgi:hypothetical protein
MDIIYYLYVIAPVFPEPRPIKVGFSSGPDDRLRELQTGCWLKLQVHHKQAIAKTRSPAKSLENSIHNSLMQAGIRRLEGEWFDMTIEQGKEFLQKFFERRWRDAA